MLPRDVCGDGPAVVLLHAGVADRTMWAELVEPLATAGHRVLAVDLPGFGEARIDPARGPWDDVLATMDAVAIDRAAVVGNSFGGAVALRMAAVAPERVTTLVLISAPAPGLTPSPELEAAWEAEESALERGDVEAAVEAVVDAWTLPDATAALRARVAAMQRRTYALQAGAPDATSTADPLDDDPATLTHLDVPAVVAVGARDRPDFLEAADVLARTLPQARHVVIDGAGHLAPLEAPAAVRALLLDVLQEG